ncbi:MAG: hypothetical protein H5T71_00630 [Chloroflexi bacterium]|nr:hypothetical protein [Chloroflexota bacterium]
MGESHDLVAVFRKRFPGRPLGSAEERLLAELPWGETVDLASLGQSASSQIAGDIIAWACSDPEALRLISHRGIRVRGARFAGQVDLRCADLPFPMVFDSCCFSDSILLDFARVRMMSLIRSHTRSVSAYGAEFDGSVFLQHGFRAEGEVKLIGARI